MQPPPQPTTTTKTTTIITQTTNHNNNNHHQKPNQHRPTGSATKKKNTKTTIKTIYPPELVPNLKEKPPQTHRDSPQAQPSNHITLKLTITEAHRNPIIKPPNNSPLKTTSPRPIIDPPLISSIIETHHRNQLRNP